LPAPVSRRGLLFRLMAPADLLFLGRAPLAQDLLVLIAIL
jgi:hypothetical protein